MNTVILILSASVMLQEKYKRYTLPLAVSIVMSGQYEDDVDNKEEVIYTGQGGHDLLGDKKQIKHQVLLRGNLALKVRHLESDYCSFNSF